MPRTYLDHAATTPMLPEAVRALTVELTRTGNPSSLHGSGRAARRVVEDARELIAERLGAAPYEVVFTSGGTEADNLALKGAFWSAPERVEVVVSAVEHAAVLDAAGWLTRSAGARMATVGVDETGRLDLEGLHAATSDRTAVVSVVWGNNEVGTLQPVAEAAEIARSRGAVAHSDAVQAVGHVPVDFAASGLDLLTLTAHKLGGPYGIGALLVRRGVALTPVLHGGGQEREVRSGTLNPAAAAGFAAAVEVATDRQEAERERLLRLRHQLIAGVEAQLPGARLHGARDPEATLPGVVNFGFDGCDAEALLLLLDAAGIDCSTGSACSSGVAQPSHVLLAMGRSREQARSALRFSLGATSTGADVAALLAVLPEVVRRARAATAVSA
ncbi:MAG: cysteine desulfurase family protein [Actinomycetes bacterium]